MKETDTKGADAVKPFTYDHAFWSTEPADPHFASQEDVFDALGTDVLNNGKAQDGDRNRRARGKGMRSKDEGKGLDKGLDMGGRLISLVAPVSVSPSWTREGSFAAPVSVSPSWTREDSLVAPCPGLLHPRFLFPPHANLRTSIARFLNACALLRV